MPHRPALYPRNWKAISAAIRERDAHRCAHCGVPDRVIGYWDPNPKTGEFAILGPSNDDAVRRAASELHDRKVIEIILTVAHLNDKNPMNCAPENLAALCQRCHLRLDRADHKRNASHTVYKKRTAGIGVLDLEAA
jgi:5-methylcytosine-specific restriction endonuclease McrA